MSIPKGEIPKEKFLELIRMAASKDTSSDPDNWSRENPLWGHGAVVSLLAQKCFGGDLLRGSLEHIEKYKHLRSHYWNRLPDGQQFDFTVEQFRGEFPSLLSTIRLRDELLSNEDTERRYNLLLIRYVDSLEKT